MPYYIYRIKSFNQLYKLNEFETFGDASKHAKTMRLTEPAGSTEKIKVIFAESEFQAEDLLSQVRVAGPKGDD